MGRVPERDTEVLEFLVQEELTGFTFDGLRRRLRLHPETLSRILYRLEELEIVERGSEGYTVSPQAPTLLGVSVAPHSPRTQVLQTLLPMDVSAGSLLSAVSGKWFGSLRWLGYSKTPERTTLKWVTSDGRAQIDGVVWDGSLSIEAILLQGGDPDTALRVSHTLLGYLTKCLARASWERESSV